MIFVFLIPIFYLITHGFDRILALIILLIFTFIMIYTTQIAKSFIDKTKTIPKGLFLLPIISYGIFCIAALLPTKNIAETPALVFLSILCISIGGYLNLRSLQTLDERFSHEASTTTKHSLETTGPYSLVRHPKYLAGLLTLFGITLVLLGFTAYFAYITLFIGYLYRIYHEERNLAEQYGVLWLDYQRRTKCLIPFIY